jgi:hypothetical protein
MEIRTFIHSSDSNNDTHILTFKNLHGNCDVDNTMKGSELIAEVSTLLCFVCSVVFDRSILPSDLIRVIK